MKLFIQVAPNNLSAYDLIKIDEEGQACLLQDTIENCLVLFKQVISQQPSEKTIKYKYDGSTHLVTDYTGGKPIVMDEIKFSQLQPL